METKPLVALCQSCGHQIDAASATRALPLADAPVGFVEVGIHCPECRTFYPAYYTNDELEQQRERLRKAMARQDIRVPHFSNLLSKAHDTLQAQYKERRTPRVIEDARQN